MLDQDKKRCIESAARTVYAGVISIDTGEMEGKRKE